MPRSFRASVPARINMLGNPADGNEGDHATISAAIRLRATVLVAPAEALTLSFHGGAPEMVAGEPPFPLRGECRLALAAVNRLWRDSLDFRERYRAALSPASRNRGMPRLDFTTLVPGSSGLGGSSLLVLLALAALREFFALDRARLHDYRVAELVQQTEELELGITCGFADRYVPLFGGLAYVDYRGKLHHRGPDDEPLATYERLDARVSAFPVVIAYTGIQGDSGDVHKVMRSRYLAEIAAGASAFMPRTMAAVGETAWRGKSALLRGDWAEVGRLMNENHRLVDEVMRYSGFDQGAGREINRLIEAARAAGAHGAKLTGAGARGSIFVVTEPGGEEALVVALREAAAREGLTRASVFKAELDCDGLTIQAAAAKA